MHSGTGRVAETEVNRFMQSPNAKTTLWNSLKSQDSGETLKGERELRGCLMETDESQGKQVRGTTEDETVYRAWGSERAERSRGEL